MKTIILRLDLNVPIDKKTDTILETERIDVVMPEIKKLSLKNRLVILSHVGKGEKRDTIKPVEDYLRSKLSKKANENIAILENTRWMAGETAKEDSKDFIEASRYFTSLGDEYIDDAFASMHRPHASIVGVPRVLKEKIESENKKTSKKDLLKKINAKVKLGDLAKFEMKNLDNAILKMKKENTLVILSGAKISTKLPLILKFLSHNQGLEGHKVKVFVSGGIANQLIKDVLGYNIGLSFFEEDFILSIKDKAILRESIEKGYLILPTDILLQSNEEKNIKSLHLRDRMVDLGRESIMTLKLEIKNAKNIIMNGPLGIYEEGFSFATKEILEFLKASCSKDKKIFLTIGGGDTLVLTKKLKIKNTKNVFISTGGGAMLEYFLYDGALPGIMAVC